jgi:hypothetical protein
VNHDYQTITLLVEDEIHSLYEIKNRFGSKIITADERGPSPLG